MRDGLRVTSLRCQTRQLCVVDAHGKDAAVPVIRLADKTRQSLDSPSLGQAYYGFHNPMHPLGPRPSNLPLIPIPVYPLLAYWK